MSAKLHPRTSPWKFLGAIPKDALFLKSRAWTLAFMETSVSQSTQHHRDLLGWKLCIHGQQEPRAAGLQTDVAGFPPRLAPVLWPLRTSL